MTLTADAPVSVPLAAAVRVASRAAIPATAPLSAPASAPTASTALDRALAELEWSVLGSERVDLAAGAARRDPIGHAGFVYVRSGRLSLEVEGATPLRLGAGDIAFFARSRSRTLAAGSAASLVEVAVTPSSERRATLDRLPQQLVVRDFATHEPAMIALVESMCDKPVGTAPTLRGGDEIICSRIVTTIASVAVRRWSESGCTPAHWLTASADPQIGRALTAVHAEIARPWTVHELARVATMSRSAFALRFREVVGQSPAGYLATVRMDAARELLPRPELTVTEIAHRLGYESEAGFSRAFRRHVGEAPAAWRGVRVR